MKANTTAQLSRIRHLYELRERQSLAAVHAQRVVVRTLEVKLAGIQSCINEFVSQLTVLDEERSNARALTVAMLQEDASSRLIVERDLRKERFYLETATKDVNDASTELANKHAQWRKCGQRLEALTQLAKSQNKQDAQQVLLTAERELDDFAISRYGRGVHG